MGRFSVSSSLVPVDAVKGMAPDSAGELRRRPGRERSAHGIADQVGADRLEYDQRQYSRVAIELLRAIAEKHVVEFTTVAVRQARVLAVIAGMACMRVCATMPVVVAMLSMTGHRLLMRRSRSWRTFGLRAVIVASHCHRAGKHRKVQPQQRNKRRQAATWSSWRESAACERNRHLPSIKRKCG